MGNGRLLARWETMSIRESHSPRIVCTPKPPIQTPWSNPPPKTDLIAKMVCNEIAPQRAIFMIRAYARRNRLVHSGYREAKAKATL